MKSSALLPKLLLENKHIAPAAKLLYAAIQVYHPMSMTDLGKISGLNRPTVSYHCSTLAKEGWITKARAGTRTIPLPIIPHPIQEQMVKELRTNYSSSPYKGEFLAKAWLDHLILEEHCVDNSRPAFLQNPITGEFLELDRFMPKLGVGIEFHGPQHFAPTNAFSDKTKFNERRARDLIKRSLCEENEVTLIILTADDLCLKGILKKFPKNLPTRAVDADGPYITALEDLSQGYKAGLSRAMAREARSGGNKQRQSQI